MDGHAGLAYEDQTAIRLTSEMTSYRENRGQKPYILQPQSYLYEASILGQAFLLYWARYQPTAVPPGDAPVARPEAGSE